MNKQINKQINNKTPHNVLGVRHTTCVIIIWYTWARASGIARLSAANCLLVTMNLKSFYTSIPNSEGISAVRQPMKIIQKDLLSQR